MKRLLSLFFAALLTAMGASAAVTEKEWCTIETPDSWEPGTPLVVKVTPKADGPGGAQIGCHLHWMKKAGWGGFLSWHPGRPCAAGKTVTFTHKPKMKDGLDRINVLVFLAPEADQKRALEGRQENVPVPLAGREASAKPAAPAKPAYPARPDSVTFKKSAILGIESPKETVRVGDKFSVTVRYRLDAADTWGDKPTQLLCMPLGPWIDNPDGKINPKRQHVGYAGVGVQTKPVAPGEGSVTFTWTLRGAFRYNDLGFLFKFKAPDGKDWPWERRGGHVEIARPNKSFLLETVATGGLYPYGKDPEVRLVWAKTAAGQAAGTVTVRDIEGNVVAQAERAFDRGQAEQTFAIGGLTRRGVFSVTVDIPGVGSEYTFFGTIPEFHPRAGKTPPFGATNVSGEELSRVIASMGFGYVRHFTGWGGLEPSPGLYQFEGLDKTIESNAAAGLHPWICLYAPPSWSLPAGIHGAGFEPSPFDLDAWGRIVATLSRRYKGKLWGWEWLNEIVPGTKCPDPVKGYLDICRAGTAAAKGVDPSLTTQLAGGLWPHNYRVDLLNAGVGRFVDFVPDHAGITLTRRDLEARGIAKVRTADNESAAGMTTWNMDAAQTLSASVAQCRHVMTRWPDELCAGAAFVTYFGGHVQATGNWTCFLDLHTPRPVAATLAVVQGKLAYARPIGKFFLGTAAVHLFEADGKAVVFVSSAAAGGEDVALPAKGRLTVTDYQGNETALAGATVHAADMPVIVEGADLDALKLQAALALGTAPVPAPVPQHVADAADTISVPFRLSNPYAEKRAFTVAPAAPGWATAEPVALTLAPGETRTAEFRLVRTGAIPGSSLLSATVSTPGIAPVEKPYRLYAIDPSSIGNLLKNGDMEAVAGGKPANWGGNGASAVVEDDPAQSGNRALRMKANPNGGWLHASQSVAIPVPGQTYLYTAWVWSHGMDAGSNLGESFQDGSHKDYYKPSVFTTPGKGNGYWQFLAKQVRSSDKTVNFAFTPVANGKAPAYADFDNISVSLYKGSDFVAFAGRDPAASSAVPLLCENQIAAEGGYAWKPSNLAGIARFSWDAEALRLSVAVEDDALDARSCPDGSDGTDVLRGDALALCLFPKMGLEGPENDQLRWYVSKASPGGGSGANTLYRPKAFALGLKSGQLARDSSTYQVGVSREGTKTVYELRIPWGELPGLTPAAGATFGCNLVLFDSDGAGKGLGRMTWGGGLRDGAGDCGLVTLLP